MTEQKPSSDSVDRWRKLLDDAENELTEKTRQWRQQERMLCSAINKITRLVPAQGELDETLMSLRAAVKEGLKPEPFQQAMTQLTQLIVNQSDAPPEHPGGELRQLLHAVQLPAEQETRLLRHLDKVHDNESLLQAIDEIAACWRQHIQAGRQGDRNSRTCAMMVSEVLLQLLERLSLPRELEERSQRLRQALAQGVEMGAWLQMLEEIADMSEVIRRRINRERLETEDFLKTLTERLSEVDRYMRGSETLWQQAERNDQRLNEAVKQETEGLRASIDASQDLDKLKEEINRRMEAIVSHLDFHRLQGQERARQADGDVQALKARLRKLEKESATLRERLQKERQAAMQDCLTGIGNRMAYEERIRLEFARWKRYRKPLSLLIWDIDHFKQINDRYGHLAGDKALKSIARILSSKVRETDFFGRYGGEEFVLIIPEAQPEQVRQIADQLRRAVAKTPFHFQGKPVTITLSCGIASFREGDDPYSVFDRADQALYQAKQQGRNRVMFAD